MNIHYITREYITDSLNPGLEGTGSTWPDRNERRWGNIPLQDHRNKFVLLMADLSASNSRMIAGNRCVGRYVVVLVVVAVLLLSCITLLVRRREHRTKLLEKPASLLFQLSK